MDMEIDGISNRESAINSLTRESYSDDSEDEYVLPIEKNPDPEKLIWIIELGLLEHSAEKHESFILQN